MSDPIKHECGVALIRLRKPLEFYRDKYGTELYGLKKLQMLMSKQLNRGQDGAGLAAIKLNPEYGSRYIARERAIGSGAVSTLFDRLNKRYRSLNPEKVTNTSWLRKKYPYAGELLLGHLRYATHGKNSIENVHPAAGFIATAYGEGRYESYGYAAGANVKDLTATASVANSTLNTISSSCVGRPTKFRGNAEYKAVRWKWFFGDGDTSSTQNPTHVYSDTGVFQAKLYVYKPTFDGCSNYDSAFVEISVYDPPIAKLSYGSICDSSTVVFNDISIIPSKEERLTTIWNIDDAPTKYSKNASNYFDTIGKFPIRMEIITKNQCRDTIIDTLVVNPTPEADFLSNDVCFSDSSYFTNTSKISSGTIDTYVWEFPNSDGDSISSPTYFLKDSGNYIITLTVL